MISRVLWKSTEPKQNEIYHGFWSFPVTNDLLLLGQKSWTVKQKQKTNMKKKKATNDFQGQALHFLPAGVL